MKALFVSSIPYLPQIFGGLNTNTHELGLELIARGHSVGVLTRLKYGDSFGVRARLGALSRGRSVSCDDGFGYPVYRARRPWEVIDQIPRPDVAVLQDGQFMLEMARQFVAAGVPVVLYQHGLDFETWTVGDRPLTLADFPDCEHLANSNFTAGRFFDRYGLRPAVVPPVCHRDRFLTERDGTGGVTFINPVEEKGVEIALGLAAACPEIPFTFVKGWPLTMIQSRRLSRALAGLPNVTVRERVSDMRPIYRQSRVLLAPSQWERETWGRVASEAQFSGIPVVGSDRGGLPEAIGPGGVVIGYREPVEVWAAALRRLWTDEAWYGELSKAAIAHADRPELNFHTQVSTIEQMLDRAIQHQAKKPGSAGRAARSTAASALVSIAMG